MAKIYSEQRPSFQLIVPNLARDLCPTFKNGSTATKNAQAIQFAMKSDEFTIQLEPGEEYLVGQANTKARILFPSGMTVDHSVFTPPVESSSYVKLDASAPPPPPADEILMCGVCGTEFEGKMVKARYANHMKKHESN